MSLSPRSSSSDSGSRDLAERVAVDVLLEIVEDRQAALDHDLAHYLGRHPGHEETVARAWLSLADAPAAQDPDPLRTSAPGAGAGHEAQHTDADAAADAPPQQGAATGTLGPYLLRQELGRGGQGIVYRAEDPELGRSVALKVLHRGIAGSGEAALRLRREAELTGKLDHPGLCTVHATGRHDGRSYIAMGLVQGESLAGAIQRAIEAGSEQVELPEAEAPGDSGRRLRDPVDRVLLFVERAARALHAAHDTGVVHRDVKPRNIMVTPEGEPVVLDFGLARDDTQGATLTRSGDVLGTPAYMSPEQLGRQSGRPDRRTDVFALGVVLFECLTLTRPFAGPTTEAVVSQITGRDAPPLRSLRPRLARDIEVVVATALERDLGRRYQSALDLAEDLRRVRAFEPILARPAGPWLRLRRWARRKPALASSLAVLLVASLAFAGTLEHLRGRQDALARERDDAIGHLARLSDTDRAQALLVQEQETLWPVGPGLVAACEAWRSEARQLLARRGDHAALLTHLEARRRDDGTYADASEALLDERLTRLLTRLELLAEALTRVTDREEASRSLERRSVTDHAEAWSTACAAVAASSRYEGLELRPQLGLVPLGENAQGLWEFWHVESGERPPWDERTGGRVVEGSGLVMVLLPAGPVDMGCHPVRGPNRDRSFAQQNEAPQHRATLDAWFVSKYELTQSQWMTAGDGSNPSAYPPGYELDGRVIVDATHPVEQVDWVAADRAVRRLGLQLPTEVQWEAACRAGSNAVWSWGDELGAAGRWGNFHGREANAYLGTVPVEAYADDHVRHAPVGSYGPNAFGLHDLHGNVFEWCRDPYAPYGNPVDPGDGARTPGDDQRRVLRGGSFAQPAWYGRSAQRVPVMGDQAPLDAGLRPSRPVIRDRP